MIKLLALLSAMMPFLAFAADPDPRPNMQAMAQEVAALQKYLLSEAAFTAPENEAKIHDALASISRHAQGLSAGAFKNDPVLKANTKMLAAHTAETEKLFASGKKNFARFMAQSSLQMCVACHTREKTADFILPDAEMGNASVLDRAQFFFATRQFERGRELYATAVSEYPQNGLSAFQLRSALLALAVFHARVKENPEAGAAYFSSLGKRKDLPVYLAGDVSAWAKDFRAWATEKPVGAKATEMQLVAAAKKLLGSDDFSPIGDSDRKFHVKRLRASALLHRVLESPGAQSPTKGEAILLLGQIYQRITFNLFFRFGEMYLKTCIREYPKSKIAQRCYASLEEAVSEGFSGSGGTNIPEEEQVELFQLKKQAY